LPYRIIIGAKAVAGLPTLADCLAFFGWRQPSATARNSFLPGHPAASGGGQTTKKPWDTAGLCLSQTQLHFANCSKFFIGIFRRGAQRQATSF
jgi:hypothetical protein